MACPTRHLRGSQGIDRERTLGFERRDRRILLEDVAQFIHAFEQAFLGEGVDLEPDARPVR